MAVFVAWKRGKHKGGRTKIEFEEHGGVLWEGQKFVIRATLFREAEGEPFKSKPMDITIERHIRNGKSQTMGSVMVDLAEYADEEKHLVNKKVKLWIPHGEFAAGLLRVTMSCRVSSGDSSGDDSDCLPPEASNEK
eukprot:CAMPEP_0169433054 /NCGR_PEP_ID=MMETSP1042-20121227/3808_1 /TAXON_ID=464988 /ORGANISM="Hemiselmis andersenii, Strain CCMP1180" /LENGTH=135 /DNA_ID=CAMNT_0009543571 /DNA_START=50 /DNA_END=454 /DNA_ORIENTATION=+